MARRHKPHYQLECWRIAFDFVAVAYQFGRSFPTEERFELAPPLRRAATSVPLNIAEGAGRDSPAEFCRFLVIAHGSITELDTIILLAERLGYLTTPQTDEAVATLDRITTLINGLLKKLRTQPQSPLPSP